MQSISLLAWKFRCLNVYFLAIYSYQKWAKSRKPCTALQRVELYVRSSNPRSDSPEVKSSVKSWKQACRNLPAHAVLFQRSPWRSTMEIPLMISCKRQMIKLCATRPLIASGDFSQLTILPWLKCFKSTDVTANFKIHVTFFQPKLLRLMIGLRVVNRDITSTYKIV